MPIFRIENYGRENKYEKTYPEDQNDQNYQDITPDRSYNMDLVPTLLQSSGTAGHRMEVKKVTTDTSR